MGRSLPLRAYRGNGCRRLGDVDRLARLAEDPLQHRLKRLERHRFKIRIEGGLVEETAEFLRLLEMRMPPECLAHVAIEPQEMKEVVALEDPVMFDDPVMLFRHEGLDDGRRNVRMI